MHSSTSQIAVRVLNRTAFARLFLSTERLTTVTPTSSGSGHESLRDERNDEAGHDRKPRKGDARRRRETTEVGATHQRTTRKQIDDMGHRSADEEQSREPA